MTRTNPLAEGYSTLTLQIGNDVLDVLDHYARKECRSRSALARILIRDGLQRMKDEDKARKSSLVSPATATEL